MHVVYYHEHMITNTDIKLFFACGPNYLMYSLLQTYLCHLYTCWYIATFMLRLSNVTGYTIFAPIMWQMFLKHIVAYFTETHIACVS